MKQLTKREGLIGLCLMVLAMAGLSLYCLPYSHAAWYDETFMADYTRNFIETGKFWNTMDPKTATRCIYGPVYFLFTGLSTKLLGFNIFTYRLVGTVFYFLCGWMMYKCLSLPLKGEGRRGKGLGAVLSLIYLLDVMCVRSSYSGRMEMVAVFFVLAAYWRFLRYEGAKGSSGSKGSKGSSGSKDALLVSLTLTLALMTTPRVVFVGAPLACYMLYLLWKEKRYRLLLAYIAIPVVLYIVWLTYQHGSVMQFVENIMGKKQSTSSSNSGLSLTYFIGGNFVLRAYHYPLFLTMLVSLVMLARKKMFKTALIYVVPILTYYIFVFDTGYYSAFMVPFCFMAIAVGMQHLHDSNEHKHLRHLVMFMFVFNLVSYVVIFTTTLATKNKRDEYRYEQWVKTHIPEGSNVIAPYQAYYAVVGNNCDFKRNTREAVPVDSLVKDFHTNYDPDYIITVRLSARDTIALGFPVQYVDEYIPAEDDNFIYRFFDGNKQAWFRKNYRSKIFKVIK